LRFRNIIKSYIVKFSVKNITTFVNTKILKFEKIITRSGGKLKKIIFLENPIIQLLSPLQAIQLLFETFFDISYGFGDIYTQRKNPFFSKGRFTP